MYSFNPTAMRFVLILALFAVTASATFPHEDIIGPRHINPRLPRMPLGTYGQRITNGEVAVEKQFPYQAGLWLQFPNGVAFCGATLISDRWLVTAAHCTDEAKNVTVVLGATSLYEKQDGKHEVHVTHKGIITHEDWQPDLLLNDIALIHLPAPVHFTDHVKPASLPKKVMDAEEETYSDYVGEIALASGFGRDSDAATSVSPVLRFIDSEVITKRKCNIRYFGMIRDTNICITGENGRSTCNGDSGGPLVVKEGDRDVLVGATSFGLALGCEVGWPAVFTRVSSYLDWIKEKTKLDID